MREFGTVFHFDGITPEELEIMDYCHRNKISLKLATNALYENRLSHLRFTDGDNPVMDELYIRTLLSSFECQDFIDSDIFKKVCLGESEKEHLKWKNDSIVESSVQYYRTQYSSLPDIWSMLELEHGK
jgi:hypothetical protein